MSIITIYYNYFIGFISIDCGSKTSLLDDSGIWYTKDEAFVETGEIHQTSPESDFLNIPYIGEQLTTLRCFPDGVRNCYTLKPKEGKDNRYLIRAFFSYGNYDGKNETQSFELHIGVNLWEKVYYETDFKYFVTEIIHSSSTDTINVCLVKTDSTIPCISTLELRLLNSSIYQNKQTISTNGNAPLPLLNMQIRYDVGASCGISE
ncbi:putative LRR receptor serine/threonine-protein kinase [Trifolium repens]|nr:putative LRR receptor serine/threonine-protein kinase [Trifolium repens]